MNRREAIKSAGVAFGLTLGIGSLTALVQSCRPTNSESWKPQFLSNNHIEFVREVADMILPRTESPSASDVLVHRFIDLFVSKALDSKAGDEFKDNLESLISECSKEFGKEFTQMNEAEKSNYLSRKEDEKFVEGKSMWGYTMEPSQLPFYRQLKSLILVGYFTSEKIGTEVLDYTPVPGEQVGCRPLDPNEKVSSI